MDEETFYLKNRKIKLLLIDRLLEGEPPVITCNITMKCFTEMPFLF
jgi:hypothetical protein